MDSYGTLKETSSTPPVGPSLDIDMARSDWWDNWVINWRVLIGLSHSYPRSNWLAS